jgi:phosphoketolase
MDARKNERGWTLPGRFLAGAEPRSRVKKPGATLAGNVPTLGNFLREVMRLNMHNFRVFGPDETQSSQLQALYEVGKNVIVADKKVHLQYQDMDAAIAHCKKGLGMWNWASNDQGLEPDVVMASCGDVPTMESLAATALLHEHLPTQRSGL